MLQFYLLLALSLLSHLLNPSFAQDQKPELILYTYDSFIAPGGLGPQIFPLFEKKFNCRVKALASGDGGQILARLQLDVQRQKPTAHLVVGIDQPLWERARPFLESWKGWAPKGYSGLDSRFKLGEGFLPYDYGVLALMADHQSLTALKLKPPTSLSDLLKSEWKRNIILEDPRTSTPGLAFLLFSRAILGNSVWDFWKQFKTQWLTLTSGWDQAYGLFLKKEAPLVWSYVTSQAYHEEHGDSQRRYQAVLFQEGQPLQIEGAAWVKGTPLSVTQKKLAQQFLEFLISPEVQKEIPRKVWMMPVLKGVVLPPSFKKLPQPTSLISISTSTQEVADTISHWSRTVGR